MANTTYTIKIQTLSIGIKDGGGTGNHAQALVKVLPSGRVIVSAAAVEIGQGATTTLSRIAAETAEGEPGRSDNLQHSAGRTEFAQDSSLEGDGFELVVPRHERLGASGGARQ